MGQIWALEVHAGQVAEGRYQSTGDRPKRFAADGNAVHRKKLKLTAGMISQEIVVSTLGA